MSRYTLNNTRFTDELVQELNAEIPSFVLSDPYAHTVVFGFDHALGYFLQVVTSAFIDGEVVEMIILDLDSMFSGLRGWQLGYLIDKIHTTTKCGTSVPDQIGGLIRLAYMDLPI